MKTIIKDFVPQGGQHCITNALKQIFYYYGYPISEAMLFGVASGLSFLYLNQASSPMINGRTKIFEFENTLANRLHITIQCKSSKEYTRILNTTKQMIDNNHPVLIYVDMPYLKYLHMDQNSHFGGHAVVLFGYDEETRKFYVSDRDNHDYPITIPNGTIASDYHLVDYQELQKARSSVYRPFPANNKYLVFDFTNYKGIDKKVLKEAIYETCYTMLNPPAKLLGIQGIEKFSKEIKKWKNFDEKKLRLAGITNYFQIHEFGGTGGGIFRKLYSQFLWEAAPILHNKQIEVLANQCAAIAKKWDQIADALWQLGMHGNQEVLMILSQQIASLYTIEKNFYQALLKEIQKV